MKIIFYLIPLIVILGCAKSLPQKEARSIKPKETPTLKQYNIDDYVDKVVTYDKNIFDFDRPVFSQENMTIEVIKLSKSQTKVNISYKINLYLDSGKFASGVKSSGYIESLLFEQIKERLNGQPLSYDNKIYGQLVLLILQPIF